MINEAQQAVSKAKNAFDAKIAEIEAREVKSPTGEDMTVIAKLTEDLGSSVSTVKSLEASRFASAEAKAAEERWALQPADRADAGHEHAAKGMRVSCGEVFTGHADYKSFIQANANTNNASPVSSRSVNVGRITKAPVTGLSSTQAGALIVNDRFAELTDLAAFGPRHLRSLFRQLTTDSDTVDYPRVVTKTNAAAPTLEATATGGSSGAAPESAMTLELVTTIVEEISHYVPVTKRAMADASQISGIVNEFLTDGLADVIESQLINGNGTSPNLRGLLNTVGIQTHVIGACSRPRRGPRHDHEGSGDGSPSAELPLDQRRRLVDRRPRTEEGPRGPLHAARPDEVRRRCLSVGSVPCRRRQAAGRIADRRRRPPSRRVGPPERGHLDRAAGRHVPPEALRRHGHRASRVRCARPARVLRRHRQLIRPGRRRPGYVAGKSTGCSSAS
jgi:HK97 family phage major capsid protein